MGRNQPFERLKFGKYAKFQPFWVITDFFDHLAVKYACNHNLMCYNKKGAWDTGR